MTILYALVLTIVVEDLIMLVLTRSKKWAYYNLLCNLVTNPLINIVAGMVWLVYMDSWQYTVTVAVGELVVFAVEALLYRAMTGEPNKKCFVRSFVTNGLSFLVGLLLQL